MCSSDLPADDACRLGLVNQVVPTDHVLPTAQALAARLAAKPGDAVGLIKRSIRGSLSSSLDEVLLGEVDHQARLFMAPEVRDALEAFLSRKRTGGAS